MEVNLQTIGGEAEQVTSAAVESRFTQDDLNRVAAKERRAASALEREHEALKVKLAGFEEAQKTESQRAIDAAAKNARAAADAEWSAKLTAQQVDSELRGRLRDQGRDPDLAHVVKAKATITSVEDIDDAINAALGDRWKPEASIEPSPVVMTGSPSGARRSSTWNAAKLADITARNMVHTMTQTDWDEINSMTQAGTWR